MDEVAQMASASLGTTIHEGHLYILRYIIWRKGWWMFYALRW
jgi:hypothetical protein